MIYLNRTVHEVAAEFQLELNIKKVCSECDSYFLANKPIRTKDSIGIEFRCDCDRKAYLMRPVTKEAIEFWSQIV